MALTTWIVAVFLACFALHYAVEMALAVLNLRHTAAHGRNVPPPLAGRIAPETARRAQAYTLTRGVFGLVRGTWGAAVTLVVLFSGVLPWLDATLAGAGLTGPHRFVAFLVALGAGLSVASLPFRLYATFGIEQRFGFNRMTAGMWLRDRAKGLALSAVLGLPLLYGVYAFMAYTGRWWWVWLFAFLTAVQVVLMWLYPTLIAPLFNRFTPLPAGELRERVQALARRAGFRTRGIYVMDASRRSGHSNAYFAGFFRPRIVLFDTLLERVDTDEALGVLAHEIGHYRERHIHKALALNAAGSLALLYGLSLLIDWPPLFAAFGFAAPSHHAALALAGLGGGAFTFWLGPLAAWFSRRNEYAADAYALRLTGRAAPLQSALVRLNEDNLANLAPHPWYSRYHYSHPTLTERLAALERAAARLTGAESAAEAGRTPGAQPAG